jgi:hypothetical protein
MHVSLIPQLDGYCIETVPRDCCNKISVEFAHATRCGSEECS